LLDVVGVEADARMIQYNRRENSAIKEMALIEDRAGNR